MEEQLSLCVSEYDDNNTLLWRRIGDYIGAMNIQFLGTMYISGDDNPKFVVRKKKKAKTK